MEDKLTLLIMAAGMGSRFGGLKQVEPVGPNNEFIIDYSIYDAIKVGFKKIIFVIKKENYDLFRDTIGKRVEDKIETEYVFQENFIDYNEKRYEREKPFGTAHAIYSAKDKIDGNFLVINSDDFYGRDAYKKAYDFLVNNKEFNKFGLVCYKAINTLTENGSVKRGICEIENNNLINIVESKIERVNDKLIANPLNSSDEFEIKENTLVSMNVLLFTPYIFNLIEKYFDEFINNLELDENYEYLIPDVIKKSIDENIVTVEVLETSSKWEGVTYKDDKPNLVNAINKLIENKEYNNNLWEE